MPLCDEVTLKTELDTEETLVLPDELGPVEGEAKDEEIDCDKELDAELVPGVVGFPLVVSREVCDGDELRPVETELNVCELPAEEEPEIVVDVSGALVPGVEIVELDPSETVPDPDGIETVEAELGRLVKVEVSEVPERDVEDVAGFVGPEDDSVDPNVLLCEIVGMPETDVELDAGFVGAELDKLVLALKEVLLPGMIGTDEVEPDAAELEGEDAIEPFEVGKTLPEERMVEAVESGLCDMPEDDEVGKPELPGEVDRALAGDEDERPERLEAVDDDSPVCELLNMGLLDRPEVSAEDGSTEVDGKEEIPVLFEGIGAVLLPEEAPDKVVEILLPEGTDTVALRDVADVEAEDVACALGTDVDVSPDNELDPIEDTGLEALETELEMTETVGPVETVPELPDEAGLGTDVGAPDTLAVLRLLGVVRPEDS